MIKKGEDLPSGWDAIGATTGDCPHQQNGHDCAVLICMAISCIIQGLPFNFTQSDMPTYRLFTADTILQGQTVQVECKKVDDAVLQPTTEAVLK